MKVRLLLTTPRCPQRVLVIYPDLAEKQEVQLAMMVFCLVNTTRNAGFVIFASILNGFEP
jgi:hypothetical protein